MSSVKVQGNASGTGIFTIASPNSNTDRTLNLPDATGTILTTATPGVPVNGPAFSAYATGPTSLPNGTNVKILFAAEEFDTDSAFTSSRFQPLVAGYYQVSCALYYGGAYASATAILYKNGSAYKVFTQSSAGISGGSCLVYLNGSTDYVEIYGYQSSGSTGSVLSGATLTWFQAAMVRSAT